VSFLEVVMLLCSRLRLVTKQTTGRLFAVFEVMELLSWVDPPDKDEVALQKEVADKKS